MLDRRAPRDVETPSAGTGDELRIHLDPADLHTRVEEKSHELATSETDIEHWIAAD